MNGDKGTCAAVECLSIRTYALAVTPFSVVCDEKVTGLTFGMNLTWILGSVVVVT